MFTEAQHAELIDRVKKGEGVRAIIQSMGIDPDQGMKWLKDNYRPEMKAAKQEQITMKRA